MWDVFPWPSVMSDKKGQTLDEIARAGDRSVVPVLIENLRYLPPGEFRDRVTATLRSSTQQSFASHEWSGWLEWLG